MQKPKFEKWVVPVRQAPRHSQWMTGLHGLGLSNPFYKDPGLWPIHGGHDRMKYLQQQVHLAHGDL